jgi:hypothetical protein
VVVVLVQQPTEVTAETLGLILAVAETEETLVLHIPLLLTHMLLLTAVLQAAVGVLLAVLEEAVAVEQVAQPVGLTLAVALQVWADLVIMDLAQVVEVLQIPTPTLLVHPHLQTVAVVEVVLVVAVLVAQVAQDFV